VAQRLRVRFLRLGSLTVVCMVLGFAGSAPGESPDETSSREARERLYDEVAREVAAIQPYGTLLKKVVRLIKPTVVHIEARQAARLGGRVIRRPIEEAGSGVVIELRGKLYVLTNRHVIDNTALEGIDVNFADGSLIHPTNVWMDPSTDVAVMRVSARGLTPARIGDSDQVEIGDFVLAMGSPFGLSHSVTYGIISAKGRRDLELGDGSIRYQDFLQTDAAINPGNSGGPLVNLRGELIGLNTAIASSSGGSEGIGFTIPINMAITVARQLVENGRTLRAYLGVSLNPNFGPAEAARLGLSLARGAHVSSVTANSPAAKAAIQREDVVIKFDGYRIEDDDHLIKVVGFTPVGKEVQVIVFRDGKLVTLTVKVVDRSRFEQE